MRSLCCHSIFCVFPTCSASGPVLPGPFMGTAWLLPVFFRSHTGTLPGLPVTNTDPLWSIVVPTWYLCYLDKFCMVPTLFQLRPVLPGPYLFTHRSLPVHSLFPTWPLSGHFLISIWSLCYPELFSKVTMWSLRGLYTACLVPTCSLPGPGPYLIPEW